MKPTPVHGAAQPQQLSGFASGNAVKPLPEARAQPAMRYALIGAGPAPSPPPKLILTSRSEPRFEIKPGPDLMRLIEERPTFRPCHGGSAPPPRPPDDRLPAPPQGAKDPRWPPGDVNRRIDEAPEPVEGPDKPLTDGPPEKNTPLPNDSSPRKRGTLRPQEPVGPPPELPELGLPLLPAIPQPSLLPPQMREFFGRTPEPALIRTLEILLSQGLDPRAKDDMYNSLLMLACATGKPAVVRFLLERLPTWSGQQLNRFGENAASLARAHCPEVLLLLLEAGLKLPPENPALQWYLGQPAGATNDASRLLQLAEILASDNYLNLADETGKTLLFHAVIRADVDVVRFLCNLAVGPAVVWRDAIGKSLFGYTTEIADVQLGSAICKELRALRRRDRPLFRRTVERF